MSSKKGLKEFYAEGLKFYYYYYHFEGIEKGKSGKKMTTVQYEEYLPHQCICKTAANTVIASRFSFAAYVLSKNPLSY